MALDVAQRLEQALNLLMLPAYRGALCAPVIAQAPPGVDAQTYPLLLVLRQRGPLSPAGLAEEIGIDRSGASRHADRLVESGLVRRSPDPIDRRATVVTLTEEGRRVIEELNDVLADYLHEMMRSWPRGEAEALVDGLERTLGWARPETAERRGSRASA